MTANPVSCRLSRLPESRTQTRTLLPEHSPCSEDPCRARTQNQPLTEIFRPGCQSRVRVARLAEPHHCPPERGRYEGSEILRWSLREVVKGETDWQTGIRSAEMAYRKLSRVSICVEAMA